MHTARAHPAASTKLWLSNRALVAYWIVAGAALLTGLGGPAVQRTQEARVLETAREMVGSGWRGWLIPHCNGQVRVRKPPLAYWMSAAAFKIGGVSEAVGRVPTALVGWLTLGVTFACADWLFGRRAAFYAAGCLLTSYLFFRHDRLAETDAPATLFVTLAIYSFWRGAGGEGIRELVRPAPVESKPAPRPFSGWLHAGAAATALAVLSKGPPGAYPLLFLLVWSFLQWRWDVPLRFVTAGAIVTLIIIASPWFVYAVHSVGLEQWRREAHELFEGEDHGGRFYQYFVDFFKATVPWVLLAPAAIVAAIQRWRDPRMRGLLVWLGVIFLPLCVVGNKQFHYLLPLMPPVMILTGWLIDQALGSSRVEPDPVPRALLLLTVVLCPLAAPAVVLVGRQTFGQPRPADWRLAIGIAAALACVGLVWRFRGRCAAAALFIAAVMAVLVPTVAVWLPSLEKGDTRGIAAAIRTRFGAGPYSFYGNGSLALCFNLRAVIPQARNPKELESMCRAEPARVVIAQTKTKSIPPPVPPEFQREMVIHVPAQTFELYRAMTPAP